MNMHDEPAAKSDFSRAVWENKSLQWTSVLAVFLAMLVIGLMVYPDYGISADEKACRKRAMINANYIVGIMNPEVLDEDLPELQAYIDKDHGVLFDLVALGLEITLGLDNLQKSFQLRHLLNFLVSFAGLIAIYQLASRRFKHWLYGLTAALFLFLSPRLFADSFYNAKDSIFMSALLFAINSAVLLYEKPTVGRALLHAFFSALAIDSRIMGVIIIPSTLALLLIKSLAKQQSWRDFFKSAGVYLAVAVGFIILFWPMLWIDPWDSFLDAFFNLSNFSRWGEDVLFMGQYIPAESLPWTYLPVWIAITTPILYVLLLFTGILSIGKKIFIDQRGKFWRAPEDLIDCFFLAHTVLPIAGVIVLRSDLYDGWRHLYFIYPTFVLIAVRGLAELHRWTGSLPRTFSHRSRTVVALILAASLISTSLWMIQAHPLQNVYFNRLAGQNLNTRFDVDYWGLSHREGLEYILAQDSSPEIAIGSLNGNFLYHSFAIIDQQERERLTYVEGDSLDELKAEAGDLPLYLFNNYKHLKDQENPASDPNLSVYYERKVDQTVILTIYRRNE
jgi:hypothetical protein